MRWNYRIVTTVGEDENVERALKYARQLRRKRADVPREDVSKGLFGCNGTLFRSVDHHGESQFCWIFLQVHFLVGEYVSTSTIQALTFAILGFKLN